MKHFKRLTQLAVVSVAVGLGGEVQAQGSSGGYASSGGSYGSSGGYSAAYGSHGSSGGGGLLSHLRSKLHAHRASASHGGSSGGYASYSASSGGASSGGASSGGTAHVGLLKRWAAKVHARHSGSSGGASSGGASSGGSSSGGASSGGYASSYASYSASSGGSSGGYATSVASYSGGSSGGAVSYSAPVVSMDSISSPVYESPVIESSYQSYPTYESAPISSGSTSSHGAANDINSNATYASAKPTLDDDAALLTVAVPSDNAVVTVNGHPTTSEGSIRQFMSRGLKEGYLYTYVVNVKYTVDGKEVVDSKSVKLRPGDTEQLVFEPSEVASPEATDQVSTEKVNSLETVVELHVPANADVVLAGNATKGYGEVRTFRTKQLKAGESWKNYTVSVTAMVDGRRVTKQRSVDVHAGDQAKLEFDFEDGTVASR
jgi:uncharacterized protein (TIGR03000 family)